MIRIVIENVLLFLLPTAIYVAYIMLTRNDGKQTATQVVNEAPLLWLFAAGGGLVMIVLVAYASIEGGKPGQGYAPAVLKDGRIVPGELK
ncbi:MAG: DUF6111 family protein [Hyphomicrobiaceae bacterium]